MKGMKSAQESRPCPPPGDNYVMKITSIEATLSNPADGSEPKTMLKLVGEIREPNDYAGVPIFDNIITDGGVGGGGFGKKKLRGLGVDVDSTDDEIPDDQIATQLLGAEVRVALKQEQIMDKDPATQKYTRGRTEIVDGRQVPVYKPVVSAYLGPVGTAAAAPATHGGQVNAPAAQAAPAPAAAAAAPAGKAAPPWMKPKGAAPVAQAKTK